MQEWNLLGQILQEINSLEIPAKFWKLRWLQIALRITFLYTKGNLDYYFFSTLSISPIMAKCWWGQQSLIPFAEDECCATLVSSKQKLTCRLTVQASESLWGGWGGGRMQPSGLGHTAPPCSLLARVTAWAGQTISAVVEETTKLSIKTSWPWGKLFFRQLQGVPSVSTGCHALEELPSPVRWACRAATPRSVHYKFLKRWLVCFKT